MPGPLSSSTRGGIETTGVAATVAVTGTASGWTAGVVTDNEGSGSLMPRTPGHRLRAGVAGADEEATWFTSLPEATATEVALLPPVELTLIVLDWFLEPTIGALEEEAVEADADRRFFPPVAGAVSPTQGTDSLARFLHKDISTSLLLETGTHLFEGWGSLLTVVASASLSLESVASESLDEDSNAS